MIHEVGIVMLFLFMLLTAVAGIMNVIKQKPTGLQLALDIGMVVAGLMVFTYFIVSYKTFMIITLIACIIIVLAAMLNGYLNGSFHLSHHIIRIILIGVIYMLLLVK
ncbi:hypothetical protein OZX69_02385 [Lactobacillus sp. ESL0731]|uniref:hypothetical protein n=1 Tax=unclassified Lactobacillus TaxID=2620435 RepID=UPI0023F80481|nr:MULTISPECIES: hypothetical protein [unclassified Lactobacillus]WEV51562.1 hypothetical protein OZX63_02385 [Lactobacillus sp. ESL0700]WEV62690.1 hypothetical protein OZX69_02385 [Lactobacillus sp. ESL0731]